MGIAGNAQAGPATWPVFYRLAGTELWERFSLHGMKALLTLYLVREVLADIPQCSGPQQRVAQGVNRRIRIGMPQKAQIVGDVHPAQNELPAGHQPVNVISVSDPHHRFHLNTRSGPPGSPPPGSGQIGW